jgi:uncharacterized membrane protein
MKRGLRLLGHPVHPMLVHLPMGLLLTAPLWDLLGLLGIGGPLDTVARWTLAVGCLGALAAMVAGLVDFAAIPAEHPANRAANLHLYAILMAVCLFGASWLVRRDQVSRPPAWLVALDLAGFLLLSAGGYFGAEMVYRHGIGHEPSGANAGPPNHRRGRANLSGK